MTRSGKVVSPDGQEYLIVEANAVVRGPGQIRALVDEALADSSNRAAIANWLGLDANTSVDELRTRMIEVLDSGATVAIVTDDAVPAGRPIMPRPKPTPVRPVRPRDPDRPPPAVRTWLALTVVDEDGHGYAGTRWTLTTPDGDDRMIELDASSSWRADDLLARGTCWLSAPSPLRPQGAGVSNPTVGDDDPWIEPGITERVPLTTAREHQVVVVRGRSEVVVLDEQGRTVAGERCEITFGPRKMTRESDANGMIMVAHPRRLATFNVRFPAIADDAVRLERSGPLANERDASSE
jgi:hypothetical protein